MIDALVTIFMAMLAGVVTVCCVIFTLAVVITVGFVSWLMGSLIWEFVSH
jgi:hypothetical protein